MKDRLEMEKEILEKVQETIDSIVVEWKEQCFLANGCTHCKIDYNPCIDLEEILRGK